jgi:predicted ester cyclase
LVGVRGTNLPVEFTAFHIVRFSHGKIAEWWGTADLLDALSQVGARVIGPS